VTELVELVVIRDVVVVGLAAEVLRVGEADELGCMFRIGTTWPAAYPIINTSMRATAICHPFIHFFRVVVS
jgi:hypothetical protein